MALMNHFVTKEFIIKHFTKGSNARSWTFAIITGIFSMGPIYMWYPLLAEAKDKGISHGLIACFLYNRAIKIHLFPVAIFYFGIKYVLILLIVMVSMSIAQGIIINKIFRRKK